MISETTKLFKENARTNGLFAMICFLVLMEGRDKKGIEAQAPSYILEKVSMLWSGAEAFGYLDHHNQFKVLAYCKQWGVNLPPEIEEYFKDKAKLLEEIQNENGGENESESEQSTNI